MRHLFDKDRKFRKNYKKYEFKNLILKALVFNIKLPYAIRENLFNILLNYSIIGNISNIKNRCVFTYRGRSIITKYKVSRLEFKRLVVLGNIMGVYKKT
jgi:ribosomal protein S14